MEEFVKALENYVGAINNNALFVLQKEIESCKFKAFKKITYTLWYIDKLRDKRFPVCTILNISRITSPEEEELVIKLINLEFMTTIFKFIRGEEFKLILGGSYEGNESLPDLDN